jgi:putative PIN family toxin of toxin-antitoxin system
VRWVLDTNVIVTAMRSPSGASAELLRRARRAVFSPLASVALAIEYQDVCSREEHVHAAGLSRAQAKIYVEAVLSLVEPVNIWFLWRPQLRDAADELVLEAAVNGRAEAIVTFNTRDFEPAIANFGVSSWTPRQALTRLAT